MGHQIACKIRILKVQWDFFGEKPKLSTLIFGKFRYLGIILKKIAILRQYLRKLQSYAHIQYTLNPPSITVNKTMSHLSSRDLVYWHSQRLWPERRETSGSANNNWIHTHYLLRWTNVCLIMFSWNSVNLQFSLNPKVLHVVFFKINNHKDSSSMLMKRNHLFEMPEVKFLSCERVNNFSYHSQWE